MAPRAARSVAVVGVPTSAGAFAPGQELAPRALREAGLLGALEEAGATVDDRGDREPWSWRPDRESPRAQHLPLAAEIVRDTAERVKAAAGDADVVLVLGGDCTVGIGTIAGVEGGVGVLYLDAHADLNVPSSVREGALDWMGMAHMLGVDGAADELVAAGGRAPLLAPEQVMLFGWDRGQATEFELAAIERLGIATVPAERVAADPAGEAAAALESFAGRFERLVVHFDVDVIDFTDAPLSENVGRNEGVPYAAAIEALRGLLAAPRLAAVTVTELNPVHAAAEPGLLKRFGADLAAAVAGPQ
jgi:arginase